jgi:hypothetical protein
LGTPDEQARPIGPPPSTAPAPTGPAPAAPTTTATTAAPPTTAPTRSAPVPAPAAGAGTLPAVNPALDYAHRLTTTLILHLAADVRHDGARFVLLIDSADLAPLDQAALQAAGIEILRADEPLGADQQPFRFPNDGHLNVAGHQRMADFLTARLAPLLDQAVPAR